MKTYLKHLLLVLLAVISVVSCIDGTLAEPDAAGGNRYLNSLDVQAALIEATVSDIRDLQETLEEEDSGLSAVLCGLEEHAATLKAGTNWSEGTLATLDHQKSLASAIGILGTHAKGEAVEAIIAEIEESAVMWLGKNFKSYYPAVAAQAKAGVLVSDCSRNLAAQKIHVEGIASDLEAGLKDGVASEEVEEVASSLDKVMTDAEELIAFFASVVSEVETAYQQALATAIADPGSFDSDALSSVNKAASVDVKSGEVNLNELIARVQVCEERLDDIESRLSVLEGKLEDIDGLLNMIQSVTFMSDYSEEYAVAYYNMGSNSYPDGKKERIPAESITLKYLVRPASAAVGLTDNSLWNNGLKVIGYTAQQITKASNLTDFKIETVTADASVGLVTVTVDNELDANFYTKINGAKVALSLTSGKTDITSKFVEIIPKDASNTVYLEKIELSKDEVEVDEGDGLNLKATISPENVTNSELVWTSANNGIVSVDKSGRITGISVGTTTVTVTSKGTDEWGRPLSATCKVKVNPSIKLSGPLYVEVGKTAELTLDFPSSMNVEKKQWWTDNEDLLTVSSDGVITGVKDTYNQYTYEYTSVTVYCAINDGITVSHDVKVVLPQPRQVRFNAYADDVKEVKMKVDQSISFAGTILPETSSDMFRLFYESTAGTLGWIDSKTGVINGNSGTMSPGTVTVYARVFEIDNHHRFAPGKSLYREMSVKVEPYWVESITLPETMTLSPNTTATLTPTFTSDVNGRQPTNTSVTWTTSNSSIVSINATTGEMTAHSEGTVRITATTASGAAANSAVKTATCVVTVKTPVAPVYVGDFYYSDGTWSTELNTSKTVIGVVFAAVNATASDNHLATDYPKCTNGLVLSLDEYTSTMIADRQWGRSDCTNWWDQNGYTTYGNTSQPVGYSNTKAHEAVNAASIQSYGYKIDWTLFNSSSPFATHKSSVATPSSASSWYVPSYAEMQLIKHYINTVNSAIAEVSGGDQVSADLYWCSSHRDFAGGWYSAFSMNSNGWSSNSQNYNTTLPFRVILAF